MDVRIGIEQMAGSFDLDCVDRWAIQGRSLPLLPGRAVEILIAGARLLSGHVDEIAPTYSERDHSLGVRGRDLAADLVDSAVIVDGAGWQGRSLAQIATEVAGQFGLRLEVDAASSDDAAIPFPQPRVQPCETGFDLLSRLARLRGLLIVSDGVGTLRIVRAGTIRARTRLVRGRNILAAQATISHAERFHRYRVQGQSAETAQLLGDVAQQVEAERTDPQIRSRRVTIIDAFSAADTADAQRIAEWARATRVARGHRGTFRVRGWLDGDAPWRPNVLVSIDDSWTRFSGDYLIVGVRYTMDDQGEVAELSVTPPDAFAPLKRPDAAADLTYTLG